jgi:hemerythrin-like metal-binding protein
MAVINWNESYSVNIDEIDKQHQKLFEMINEFYTNVVNQSNEELILKLVNGMRIYVQSHFYHEEELMKKYEYPDFKIHKQQHDTFIQKVTELETKLNKGIAVISFEITSFLKDWIKNHILTTDKLYSKFLNEKGVK